MLVARIHHTRLFNSQNALAGDENTYTLNLGPRIDHMHLVLFTSGGKGNRE